jgi:transglutaminase-like putative cysteine protease
MEPMMNSVPRGALTILVALVTAVAIRSYSGVNRARVRTFHLEYKAELPDLSGGAKRVDLWLPVPHDDPWQQITNLDIQSTNAYETAKAANGNKILHVGVNNPAARVAVLISLDATRDEHTQPALHGEGASIQRESREQLAAYLKPDRLLPVDEQIRSWAQEVVEKANAHTDLEKARAIYDHVVSTVKYDKSGHGWGRGDIYYACQTRRGNCTDFHAIFIGYCRALGIPARFAIGFPLPPERGQGIIAGYHCWAEFYASNVGWVPIDASEAAKNQVQREYFFGAHDENRIEFSKDRDLALTPRQHGDLLNYFIYPYAEVDGKSYSKLRYEVAFRDEASATTEPLASR